MARLNTNYSWNNGVTKLNEAIDALSGIDGNGDTIRLLKSARDDFWGYTPSSFKEEIDGEFISLLKGWEIDKDFSLNSVIESFVQDSLISSSRLCFYTHFLNDEIDDYDYLTEEIQDNPFGAEYGFALVCLTGYLNGRFKELVELSNSIEDEKNGAVEAFKKALSEI